MGYFREELVVRRQWISEAVFAELVGITQLLPGPSSSQTGFLIGISRGGMAGGLAAWAGFTLPSAMLMILFAAGVSHAHSDLARRAFQGLQAAAVTVVAAAVVRMFRTLCPDLFRAMIACGVAIFAVAWTNPLSQMAAILAGAAAGLATGRQPAANAEEPFHLPISHRAAAVALALYGVVFSVLEITAAPAYPALQKARAFYRTGALVFGGGHVVLPLLEQAVVRPGWVDQSTFLSGYGAAQTLPGPLFAFSAYLGHVSPVPPNGILGALICLAAIFLPGLLLAVAVAPFWQQWRQWNRARSAFAGINAAVVGLLMAALFQAAASGALPSSTSVALAAAGAVALLCTRISPVVVVAAIAAVSAIVPLRA